LKISGFSLALLLVCVTPAAHAVEYKAVGATENNPACAISADICVPTYTFRKVDYEKDEMLLTYDNGKPSDTADAVLKKYKLRVKHSDNLESIKTTMVTAATNGQDPFDLVQSIKKSEKDVDASTSNFYRTATFGAVGTEGYPLNQTGVGVARSRTGGRGIVIGMIDTPIDIVHDSLRSPIERVELVSAGDPANRLHGTEVAGVMVSQNPRIGVAPEASLLAISAFSVNPANPNERRSNSGLVARALEIAINRHVDVLNLSFAGGQDPIVDKLVQQAVQQGIVVVASAGNAGPGAPPAYPAAVPGVLAVTAVDEGANIFSAANRGDYIDLSAPGVGILTTAPGGAFHLASGTSLATAHASGVIALLMSLDRRDFLPDLLNRTAVDLGRPGRDSEYGYGLISVGRALGAVGR
jgi:subtilisin family serine protease